jgi:hypothetical protein
LGEFATDDAFPLLLEPGQFCLLRCELCAEFHALCFFLSDEVEKISIPAY